MEHENIHILHTHPRQSNIRETLANPGTLISCCPATSNIISGISILNYKNIKATVTKYFVSQAEIAQL